MINKIGFGRFSSPPHEAEHKPTMLEFGLALLIAIALGASLFSERIVPIPSYLTPILIIAFLSVKIYYIIRKGGTLLEDYASIGAILLFIILYFVLGRNLDPILITIFIFIIIYAAGMMLWVRKTFGSHHIAHFITSYLITICIVIFLFAGAYISNNDGFKEEGRQKKILFEEAIYYSTITITTVGYGDITPLGLNRGLSAIEALIGMVINVALLGFIFSSNKRNHD